MWERDLLPKYSPVICSFAAKILQMLQELSNSSTIDTAPTQTLALEKKKYMERYFFHLRLVELANFPGLSLYNSLKHIITFFSP